MVSFNVFDKLVGPKAPHLGLACYASPPEAKTSVNTTVKMGKGTEIIYSILQSIPKMSWRIKKVDEWINVSPVHSQFYQLTTKQKEDLESKIKQGLASVSQSVADLELLKHDLRKYKEFINHLDHGDEEYMKYVFIDQVDYHAGSPGGGEAGRLSMVFMRNKNIMPTIVQDFLRMKSIEDVEKDQFLSKLPKVEKDMLKTKWKAYQEWKKIFGKEVRERYRSLLSLVRSRRMSVDEYKNWLKPYIAKHKLIKEGLSESSQIKKEPSKPIKSSSQAVSENVLDFFVWHYIDVPEFRKKPGELIGDQSPEALDDFVKRNLIFDLAADFPDIRKKLKSEGEKCLVEEFPWITEDWVKDKSKKLEKEGVFGDKDVPFNYFSVYPLSVERNVIRTPDGEELEDVTFELSAHFLTKNLLLVKLLEIEARNEEFERYINQMIGSEASLDTVRYRKDKEKITVGEKEYKNIDEVREDYPEGFYNLVEDKSKPKTMKLKKNITDFFEFFGLSPRLRKKGKYETDFKDRITSFYLTQVGGRFGSLEGSIKKTIGVGN